MHGSGPSSRSVGSVWPSSQGWTVKIYRGLLVRMSIPITSNFVTVPFAGLPAESSMTFLRKASGILHYSQDLASRHVSSSGCGSLLRLSGHLEELWVVLLGFLPKDIERLFTLAGQSLAMQGTMEKAGARLLKQLKPLHSVLRPQLKLNCLTAFFRCQASMVLRATYAFCQKRLPWLVPALWA
ncbi:unnamed protein product [Symbiodinium natans]|uniref:Uncharacterized protein n=1 Tax=Symbiodinium natans TaxID=878477 RepID=A0A812QP41_9DINO|nr:unnamed protein product [Symbiodinium natans]